MINEAIERAAEKAKATQGEADVNASRQINVTVDPRLLQLTEEAGAHVTIEIPEQSPQGPHVLMYSTTTRTWRGVRLPPGRWTLERERPRLWQPGAS